MKNRNEAKGKPDLNMLFIYNIPFRAIAKMTGGMVSMEMAEGMVRMVNGHFLKGIRQIIGGAISNKKGNKLYSNLFLEGVTEAKMRGQKEDDSHG